MKKHTWVVFLLSALMSLSVWGDSVHEGNSMDDPDKESLNQAFGNQTDLTDEEAYNARTFKHEGYRERKKNEACKEQGVNCDSEAYKEGVLMNGELENHLGKAYAMIFGGLSFLGGGGGPSVKTGTEVVKDDAGNVVKENGKAKTQDKKTNDYCLYAAMGWEMVAMLIQQDLNGNVEQEVANIKDIQVKALVALKKNHQARQKTATIQSVVYGAVSLCYVGYAIAGGYQDPMLWVKMAGAGFLTGLYIAKAIKHAKAADAVQRIIDSLPSAGDCNPWTGTSCFCRESTSPEMYPNEYQHACVKKLGPLDLADGKMGCGQMVNGQMTFDKQCKCKQNNTCFKTQVQAFTPNFDLGNNVLSTANKGFDLLNDGDFNHAKLSAYSTEAKALALKSFPKNMKLPKVKLNDQQKKDAAEIAKVLPPGLAAIAAAAPQGKPPAGLGIGNSAALDKVPDVAKKEVAEAIKGNYNTKGGGGSVAGGEEEPQFKVPNFGEQKEADNSAEILSFAEKAMNNADVNNTPETPIFDIISNRYRRSWNRVESAEMKAAQ